MLPRRAPTPASIVRKKWKSCDLSIAEKRKLLTDENDRAFGSRYAARALDGHGEFIDTSNVLGQLHFQYAVARCVCPTDARRDGWLVTADGPKFETLASILLDRRQVRENHESRLPRVVPVDFGNRLRLRLRVSQRGNANGRIHNGVERCGLVVDSLLQRGCLQRLPLDLLAHLFGGATQ